MGSGGDWDFGCLAKESCLREMACALQTPIGSCNKYRTGGGRRGEQEGGDGEVMGMQEANTQNSGGRGECKCR